MPGLLNPRGAAAPAGPMPQMGGPAPGGSMPGGPMPGAPAAASPTMAEDETNVSPEEQQLYNEFVKNGMKLLYNEKGTKAIVKALDGGGNPVQGLANTLVAIVSRLDQSAKEKGKEFPGDVMLHGAQELLEQMADFSEQSGGYAYDEKEMETAFYMALDMYRQNMQDAGQLDQKMYQGEMAELETQDEQGMIEDVLPGITAAAQEMQGMEPPPGQSQPQEQEPPRRGLLG